ncbi:ABC transporter ATP-binding protein [Erysipelothrix urinaevulpis]|uniref:ATP-binding cassette domain-containing protein n=1 Tax=Erysipelothrix urinaevulpis TaxID=2683717 RepID=UPI001357CE60|nr:ABC transporter ATP-binding protein [Erysipelothrix urinaevulpis]
MKSLFYKEKTRKWWWAFLTGITLIYLSTGPKKDPFFPIYIFIVQNDYHRDLSYLPQKWSKFFKESLIVAVSYFVLTVLAFFIIRNFTSQTIYNLINGIETLFLTSAFIYLSKITTDIQVKFPRFINGLDVVVYIGSLILLILINKSEHFSKYPLERAVTVVIFTFILLLIVTVYKWIIHTKFNQTVVYEASQDFTVDSLSYRYKKGDRKPALNDVNISAAQGEILGIVGKHGAGKTTLMRFISGELNVNDKPIYFEGETINKDNLGYVPVDFPFKNFSKVSDVVNYMSHVYSQWNQDEFDGYAGRYNIESQQKIKELSLGMQQRLMIAIALSHQARLLVMDEPTDGIDGFTREDIIRDIQNYNYKYNATIIIATHQVEFYENILDKIVYLDEGKVELKTDIITFQTEYPSIKEYILSQTEEE